jgi:hypothetical protein
VTTEEIDDDAPVRYGGRLRIVEPHDFGAMNGTSKVLVYQLHADGGPPDKAAHRWRLLDVAKIEVCKVLGEQFAGSRGHSHEQHMQWDAVFARVE